ncbi:MAG TPA: nitroreductase family protein [Acetobacteraceae bacterium]|nr:nitroreductase family protein [Acetobacteraceae bacterium]
MSDISLFEAIHTARSQRRLKPDPVPEALITRVLDAAIRASSAGNAQNWAFLVVRDTALRRQLGAVYRKASDIASAMYAAKGRPAHLSEAQYGRLMTTGAHLWDHMGDAPVILIPCLRRPDVPPVSGVQHDAELAYANRIRGSSIYPAVQNIILACRALGLGTTITTNHLRCEDEVRALLGLPDDVDSFAMMPIGWPIDPFGPLSRKPLSAVAHADRWGNAWPG